MIKNIITQHFQRYRERSPWSFCWRITVEGLVVPVAFIALLESMYHTADRSDLPDDFSISPMIIFISLVILAPLTETLLLQSFPIFLTRVLGVGFRGQVLTSMVAFAVPHFFSGVGTGIGAGIIGGFYSAFTYAHWREKSRWTAFWTTYVSHGFHNLIIFGIVLLADIQ